MLALRRMGGGGKKRRREGEVRAGSFGSAKKKERRSFAFRESQRRGVRAEANCPPSTISRRKGERA